MQGIGLSELREMYAYTAWANELVLESTGRLAADQLLRDLGSSFPSVAVTLTHIAQADWIWLQRWRGESPGAPPDWDTGTHAAIATSWRAVMQDREAYLLRLEPADLGRVIVYRRLDGSAHANPLWQVLLHVVNHATYHRGQVVTMLRQLGSPGVSTDMVRYFRECAGMTPERPVRT